jgi:hypothetical protein
MRTNRPFRWSLALVLSLLSVLELSGQPASDPRGNAEPDAGKPPFKAIDANELRPGMSAAEVRQKLGAPRRTSRQILYGRYLEQWTYDGPVPVRIEFDWRKGQERQILTVQSLTLPPR